MFNSAPQRSNLETTMMTKMIPLTSIDLKVLLAVVLTVFIYVVDYMSFFWSVVKVLSNNFSCHAGMVVRWVVCFSKGVKMLTVASVRTVRVLGLSCHAPSSKNSNTAHRTGSFYALFLGSIYTSLFEYLKYCLSCATEVFCNALHKIGRAHV